MTTTTLELKAAVAAHRKREKALRQGLSARRRKALGLLATCWAWTIVLAWGPIAAWRMSRSRSPYEFGPERWRD